MPNCFPAGTLISTETGLRPIEEVFRGDRVWAYDVNAARWELDTVTDNLIGDYDAESVVFQINGDLIQTT